MSWKTKLQSRTFWICVATFLASVGTSVSALQTGNDALIGIGIFCATLSAAIFAAADAVKDSAYTKANATITTVSKGTTISANSDDNDIVKTALATDSSGTSTSENTEQSALGKEPSGSASTTTEAV